MQASVTAPVPCLRGTGQHAMNLATAGMRALHVVVEDRVAIVILVEQPLCIADAEIFKVEKAVRVIFADELHESMHGNPVGQSHTTADERIGLPGCSRRENALHTCQRIRHSLCRARACGAIPEDECISAGLMQTYYLRNARTT